MALLRSSAINGACDQCIQTSTLLHLTQGMCLHRLLHSLPDSHQCQDACADVMGVRRYDLLPFCYMSFYVADRKFYAADVAAGLYHSSAYYAAQSLAGAAPAAKLSVCIHVHRKLFMRHVLHGLGASRPWQGKNHSPKDDAFTAPAQRRVQPLERTTQAASAAAASPLGPGVGI